MLTTLSPQRNRCRGCKPNSPVSRSVAPEHRLGGDFFPQCFALMQVGGNFQSMPHTARSTLTVRVLLFASYADTLGMDSVELTLPREATVEDALKRVRALPGGERLPPKPLCAINLSHVRVDAPLSGGDELAILPPLAGG